MTKQSNILFTLIVATILVVCLSFVLPKQDDKYLSDMFWVRKTFAPSNKTVVLMGDSRVYRGLSPDVMQKELPTFKILNFGFSNGGLNTMMFNAAEQKLSVSAKTKVIVIGVTANSLSDYTNDNKQYLQELNRPREEVLERLYLTPISYWFSATSPEELKRYFRNKNEPKNSYYISNYKMTGYVESDKFPVDTLEAISSYKKDFSNFQVDEKHLLTLFAQVRAWTKAGILVLAYRPPISQPMLNLENDMALYNEQKISEGIINAGGHWIDLRSGSYKTYDGSHVDRPSAEKLSAKIAREIQILLQQNK